MKFNIKLIPWLIIGILVILLFLQRSCQTCPKCPETKTDTVTTVKYDTIERIVYIDRPYPYAVILPGDTVIDSTQCIEMYYQLYSQNIYNDTLLNDSTALISINDTVWMNELQHRKLNFVNRRPQVTQVVTNTILGDTARKRNKVFIGLLLGRSLSEYTVGLSLMLVTKKEAAYSISVDPVFKNVYGSIFYKIRLCKK